MTAGSQLVDTLLEEMRRQNWPEFDVLRVQLAYEEAITNAIRHGNRHSPDKTVDVTFRCGPETVTVTITDQGDGFNPESIPDPREEDLLEVPGGRGVLLIREVMSRVHYNETGNQLTMEKDRAPECPPDFE